MNAIAHWATKRLLAEEAERLNGDHLESTRELEAKLAAKKKSWFG